MKIKISLLLVAVLILGSIGQVLAAGNSLYLSSTKSAAVGSTLSVSLRLNSADAVNAVQAYIMYPTDSLDYLSTSYGGTAFEIQAESSAGGGNISIGRGTMSPVTGNRLIATINFRVKASSGSATINLGGNSTLANNGQSVAAGLGGTNVAFTPPAPKATPAPVPPVDKTPPAISDIKVTDIKTNSATITWKTNEPADSVVNYGLDSSYGLTVGSPTPSTVHSVVLSSAFIKPLKKYSFVISSTDTNGNKQTSQPSSFKAAGIAYMIQVNNTKNQPLAGANVNVEGQNQKTDKNGQAKLFLSEGDHTAVIDIKGKKTYKTFSTEIGKDYSKTPMIVVFNVKATPSYIFLILALICFVIGLLLGYLWHVSSSPIKYLEEKGQLSIRHKYMKVSQIEKHYGDDDQDSNPFHKITPGRLLNNLIHHKA